MSQNVEQVYNTKQPIAVHQGGALSLDVPASAPGILVVGGCMVQVLKTLVETALCYTPLVWAILD